MKKILYSALAVSLMISLASCGNTATTNTADSTAIAESTVITGNDRDSHDCIASAGYTWSVVLGECIRIFEEGVRLTSPETPGYAAYIVFAVDSSRVEVFSPGGEVNVLDRRTLPDGSTVWNTEDDDTKNVRKIEGAWIVSKRDKVIYYSE